ncbi:hypothetical protein H7U28_06450 [Coprobacillus cateniformis]|nr:hypothetical protein [Coprobacillus cateniformis]
MEEFTRELLKCINLCDEELKNRSNGVEGESTIEQLKEVILPELKEVLAIIERRQLPPSEERYLNSFASAFTVWGWDMQNPTELFTLLTKLNNDYEEL